MSFINAVWIDSEDSFIASMKDLFQGHCHITHYPHFDDEKLNNIAWNDVDVLLMDLKLHEKNTLTFIPILRKKRVDLPVVIVTAHANTQYCIEAINMGVNGFAEKPVDADFLKSILERHRSKRIELKMCHDRKAVFSEGQWVDLTSTEYKILEKLKSAKKRLTRSELQSAVWPNSSISENNLDTHLTNLKRKIPELNQLLNVKRGLGYYLETSESN